jgi:hypothetical protein
MVQLRLIVCAETVQLGLEVENRTGMALWCIVAANTANRKHQIETCAD